MPVSVLGQVPGVIADRVQCVGGEHRRGRSPPPNSDHGSDTSLLSASMACWARAAWRVTEQLQQLRKFRADKRENSRAQV